MKHAAFRFYAELNDFLPPDRRMVSFDHPFLVSGAVKDMIEALGVPHTEVDLILINGESVDFSHPVQDGDRISVYPVFESFDITPLVHVRPSPLRQTRFVLDTHLGTLAVYLRMVGFDTLYSNDYGDETLARISSGEGRILSRRMRTSACRTSSRLSEPRTRRSDAWGLRHERQQETPMWASAIIARILAGVLLSVG